MKRLHLILAGLALAAITTPAQAIQIPVTGDTTATASSGSAVPNRILKTAGTSSSLPVGPKSTPVLFFNLTNSGITPSAITKARLVIYFSSVTKAGTFKTLFPTTAFQELFTTTSVPFTAPTGLSPDEPVTTANKKGYVISYGFEEVVKSWINNPASNNGVAIVGDALLSATISSREGAATGVAAFLEIDVNPTAGAVGATTLATTGNATVGGTLGVTGQTTFNDFVTIANNKALTISGSGGLGVGGNINCSNDISAYRDLYAERNLTVIGTSTLSGNVGIGTTTPNNKLQIESAANPQVVIKHTGTGGFAGLVTQTSNSSWYFGCRNGSSNWSVYSNDDGAPRLNIQRGTGFVGIGTESPAIQLQVNGGVFATFFTPVSDRRLKKNFTEITGGLDSIQKLRPVSYDWRRDEFPEQGLDERRHLGFVAQEIREVLPHVVSEKGEFLRVEYDGIIPVLTRAIQELKAEKDAEIAALKEKIAALEARAVARVTLDAELEARLVRLEAASSAAAPVKAVTTAFTGKE